MDEIRNEWDGRMTSIPRMCVHVNVHDILDFLGVEKEGIENFSVSGLASDNREVSEENIFIALSGQTVHGAKFAVDACRRGAIAVMSDTAGEKFLHNINVPVIIVEHLRDKLGGLCDFVYGKPSARMNSFAVTGTNGKTTTTFMINHILTSLGRKSGLIGTVATKMGDDVIDSMMTTPQPVDLQNTLAWFHHEGASDFVMEVSSHALALKRTQPILFSVAGFTNLTQDHLDFHESFDDYYSAKALLFNPMNSSRAVIMIDDEWGKKLYDDACVHMGKENVCSLSASSADNKADFIISDIEIRNGQTYFSLYSRKQRCLRLSTTLPGEFNIFNAALAALMVYKSGVSFDDLDQMDISPHVPGRMEVVAKRPRVIVDFAHNADALEKAMRTLIETTQGRLIVLTGSAGERDQGKRADMGYIVAKYADVAVITDDDPHREDPARIRRDILDGMTDAQGEVKEIPDRCKAIEYAIRIAEASDTVLLAGRGHEKYQYVADGLVELDDREEARKAIALYHEGV
ncbi:MAG: UDP-N-acetylmuramoyl-L-alanyl-D-glutamate--2,6-diaminopimelate ligase [Actinomycetaceae bacterium]|nr:UDP-N-acetylmuramoyl-L-alanyl-D-glutamate--2,6-diaminopimelate ligase [Actinomycetaceae bacterium]